HLRWSPRVERQAEEHVRRAFGFGDKAPLPQYVAVHIPRCGATQCVPPVSELERLVSSIYASLIASQTLTGPSLVFVLSESPLRPAWRAAASALAWIILDAASPPVDAAVLSGAIGYVGVLGAGAVQEVGVAMAARRVREWRGGVVRMHQLEGASAEFA
ncbi:uncharacterized protein BXZ73DRAFT_97047, partial [Epithele typhae]|uniref:uncharacterized protein n=1 Tax=Epithele typhae TaxID=378194 RepID=UPI002008DA38